MTTSDRHGTPLAVTLTGGNRHDVTQLLPLLNAVLPIRGLRGRSRRTPRRLDADRGYDFDKYRRLLWKRGIKPVIARRGAAHGSGLGKVRWAVERALEVISFGVFDRLQMWGSLSGLCRMSCGSCSS
ncbi:IS5 family transposase, partial [Streptomyces griseochromogenes]|nr:IS5 family transposase [Streptomyces griseochromogenes]